MRARLLAAASLAAALLVPAAGAAATRAGDAEGALRPGSAPHLKIVTRTPRVTTGALLTIEVRARDLADAVAVAFHVVYDPTLLEPVPASFTEGPLLRQGGATTTFLAAPASTGERVVVGAGRLGAPRGAHGSGVLLRMAFRARGEGAGSLVLDRAAITRTDGSVVRAGTTPARLVVGARRDGKR